MLLEVNEFAVLVSALLALALGSIWYSPLVFGKHWQHAAGVTDADLVLSTSSLIRFVTVGLVSNIIVMYVMAFLLRLAEIATFSQIQLAGSLVALLGASVASMVVWEKKSLMYFLIHVGYGALVVCVGGIIITLWPW